MPTGELIFVPHGWWHIVLNVEDSIAITQNYGACCNQSPPLPPSPPKQLTHNISVSRQNIADVVEFMRSKPDQISGRGADTVTLLDEFTTAFDAVGSLQITIHDPFPTIVLRKYSYDQAYPGELARLQAEQLHRTTRTSALWDKMKSANESTSFSFGF